MAGRNKLSVGGITPGQYAELAGVTPTTVRAWIKNGAIPANKTPGSQYRIPHSFVKEQFPEWIGVSTSDEISVAAGTVLPTQRVARPTQ